eukprot:scaffold145239_cov133-Phaeocystis_antarctica.AAC.1
MAHIAAWPSPGSLITRSVSQCSLTAISVVTTPPFLPYLAALLTALRWMCRSSCGSMSTAGSCRGVVRIGKSGPRA